MAKKLLKVSSLQAIEVRQPGLYFEVGKARFCLSTQREGSVVICRLNRMEAEILRNKLTDLLAGKANL